MYKNTESQRCPGRFQSWEATGRLWFSILAWMRRVGAESLFWQQLMWCETAFNDTRSTSKSYFIWHLRFVFHQTWRTISVILWETKRVLCLTQSTFLLTGLIAKCVVADPQAKQPILVISPKFVFEAAEFFFELTLVAGHTVTIVNGFRIFLIIE